MSTLTDLIDKIDDQDLRKRIQDEVNRLTKQKKFGLVYEHHMPECTPLYDLKVKRGATVALKVAKGADGKPSIGSVNDTYTVLKVDGDSALCVHDSDQVQSTIDLDNLVCVAKFGDPIYPYLKQLDAIRNAPDSKLWHTLIEADNYHALQLLVYLYGGQVDCIYIDPPYNTGAKDWKYNNDYVDGNDSYRHSKWLSMMEKRLKLAKQLLNPKDSVLVVTIDEKEYLHLGCLLEEMFPDADIQMVTSVISAKGVVRAGRFSRVEEYIYYVMLGSASVCQAKYNMLDEDVKKEANRNLEWLGFRRRAPQAVRSSRPNQFYPIFVDEKHGYIKSIGDVVPHGVDRNTVDVPKGCVALWPLSKDGDERLWSLIPSKARENFNKGYLRVNNWDQENRSGTVYYLPTGTIQDIEKGEAKIIGRNDDGSVIALYNSVGTTPPKKLWNMKTHNAETFGTSILQSMIGNRFPYPKSLYAERDTIRFCVADKPNALIVDFFAGSGTTLHSVNLLNAEDGGNRRCILVTNNEVHVNEAKDFLLQGLKPGDAEWVAKGVARYVTWPRTVCSIKGEDINGKPLDGKYVDTDINMADGFKANAVFYQLGFLDKNSVALGKQFKELLPMLWLKAGAVGECPKLPSNQPLPDMLIQPDNKFAVLINELYYSDFAEQLAKQDDIDTVYIVTDSESGYREMISHLNVANTYQLYRDYLDNFRINRAAR